MSPLGEEIRRVRERLNLLVKSCLHPETHAACEEEGSAMVCDDCGKVVKGGVLSLAKWSDGPG